MKGSYQRTPTAVLWLMIAATAAHADDARSEVTRSLPGTVIDRSAPSVVDGLYEVVAGENLLYVDATGRYLLIGSIYDLQEGRDLSAERRGEIRRAREAASTPEELLDQVPIDAAVITGAGPRTLNIIMDPACGWCRRLWAESLRDLDGVRVRHLLPNYTEQIVGILCASDPAQALTRALSLSATTAKTPVPSAECRRNARETIARVAGFTEQAGLHGTPVLIRDDGAVHQGYLGRTALLSWLEERGDDAS